MGGSKAIGKDWWGICDKLLVENHMLQVWDTLGPGDEQWNPIQCDRSLGMVHRFGDYPEIHIYIHIRGSSQASRKVEVTSRTIVNEIQTKLEIAGGNWVDKLGAVLLAYMISPRTATGEPHLD